MNNDKLLCLVEGGNARLNMFGYYALTLPAKIYLDEQQINILKTLGYKVTVLSGLNEVPLDALLTNTPKVDLTVETPVITGGVNNTVENIVTEQEVEEEPVKRSRRK